MGLKATYLIIITGNLLSRKIIQYFIKLLCIRATNYLVKCL